METKKEMVEMTTEERQQFEAYKAEQEKKQAELKHKQDVEAYAELVEDAIQDTRRLAMSVRDILSDVKSNIYSRFKTALDMKSDLFNVKESQRTHTFTSRDGKTRVSIGFRCVDSYADTAEQGVLIVKEALAALGKDENSQALVGMVLSLLTRDATGSLNAQRILQLRKVAEDSHNEKIIEGVKIISDAYRPQITKAFVSVAEKSEENGWEYIPLSMTDAKIHTDAK